MQNYSSNEDGYTNPNITDGVIVLRQGIERQELLWIPVARQSQGRHVKMVPPIGYKGKLPDHVWSLYTFNNRHDPPTLPYAPVHQQNAFLEGQGHDWSVVGDLFMYRGATDGGCWALLEFNK